MPDESQLRRQVLLRLAGSATVLAPTLLGGSAALAFWALEWNPRVVLFSVLAGVLGSVGALFTQALLGGPELRAAVERELTQADRDPRPEAALRDLRALRHSFEQLAHEPVSRNSVLATEVLSQVRQLSERAVASLRQTMDLQQTAGRLTTPVAAAPLLAERERLIGEVQATVHQLGQTLASWQALGSSATGSELRRLRTELDDSLQAARRAETRLEEMLSGPGRDPEPRPPAADV